MASFSLIGNGQRATHSPHLFRLRNFRTIILGKFFVTISFQIISITAFWEILQITNSPLWLGLAGLAEAGPVIFCSLFSGYFIDLYRKKKILILCNIGFLLLSLFLLSVRLNLPAWILLSTYLTMACLGFIRSFYSPTNVTLLVASVPRARLPESSALNGSLWHIAFFGGSFLGGLLNGFFEPAVCYATSAIFMGVALGWNSRLDSNLGELHQKKNSLYLDLNRGKQKYPKNLRNSTISAFLAFRRYLNALAESIHFLKKQRILLAGFSVDMMVVFFAGAIALLPIFADSILFVGAKGLGALRAAPGVGALCISLFLSRYPSFLNKHTGRKMLSSMSLFGISMFFFAISENFSLSLFFLFLSGIFDGISVVIRSSLLQILSPEAMRGRLAAINSIFVSSSNELGAAESGITAEIFGTVPSVILGSLFIQALLLFVVFRYPELKKMDYHTLLYSKLKPVKVKKISN